MKKPWFSILAVYDLKRSMADIAVDVANTCRVSLGEMRGAAQRPDVVSARWEAFAAIREERPDLSASIIGRYFNKDCSTVNYALAQMRKAGDRRFVPAEQHHSEAA